MADFRKWIFAFAVLALMLGASTVNAQVIPPGGGAASVVCNLNPANPTIVSAENISALVGDYVLICNGGTPTPAGTAIPSPCSLAMGMAAFGKRPVRLSGRLPLHGR